MAIDTFLSTDGELMRHQLMGFVIHGQAAKQVRILHSLEHALLNNCASSFDPW